MDREQYEKLAELEDRSWWFRLKREIVFNWLREALPPRGLSPAPRVADVGCGTGGTLSRLPFEVDAIGLEYDREAARIAAARGVRRMIRGEAGALPLDSGSCDAVLMLDVLEHLADDELAMVEAHRVLAPGGVLLVTVPAHPFLWSPHDVAFHHHRRYRVDELEEKLGRSRFDVERVSFAFATAFPVACAVRPVKRVLARWGIVAERADDFGLLPASLEALAHRLTIWEARWLARRSLPFGISIVAVARRSEDAPAAERKAPRQRNPAHDS